MLFEIQKQINKLIRILGIRSAQLNLYVVMTVKFQTEDFQPDQFT